MTDLDATFAALGDGTRRAIVMRLAKGPQPVSQLAEPFDMSLTAVSKHVRVLADAGLVVVTKRGRTRYCELKAAPMQKAFLWLEDYRQFWDEQLDALGQFLAEDDE